MVGSGLCILSKYPITMTLFHSWSVNGYVHRVQHGDWFGGKGVGLCQIMVQKQPVNIYIAHVRCYREDCVFSIDENGKSYGFSFMLNMTEAVTTTKRIE